ncbi:MAG: ribonuclease P protein component [Hyphomicrobiales bacterium]
MRLKKRAEFLAAAKGRRCSRATLTMQCRRRDGDESGPRFGYTVTKKTGCSVERNRMRRRFREAVRKVAPEHAAAGHDYVLIARRPALEAPFASIVADIVACLQRFGGSHGPAKAT